MLFIVSILFLVSLIIALIALVIYISYRNSSRELKNYERGLKMVSLMIHLPPSSEDIDGGGRDKRDVVEETIAPAEVMYNILASTAKKGFKSTFYGQKHIGFEIIAVNNTINYYVAAPVSLIEVIEQAVTSAYPSARIEEVEEYNLFNAVGKIGGTIGGEISLAKEYAYPIATFKETKRDTMQSLLNSLISLEKQDGVGLQILLRPAHENWAKNARAVASNKKKGKKDAKGLRLGNLPIRQIIEAPFKVPEWDTKKDGDKPKELSSSDQSVVEAIEGKTQYPGFEVLIRLVVSSNTSARAQSILNNLTATFALYNAEGRNGLKFNGAKDIEKFVTSFIFRFFPQEMNKNIMNSIELATLFHLPDQKNTPTSKLQRQSSKQIDGPSNMPTTGQLIGYNLYRGIKKEIRISEEDRLRHMYIVGQTGTGKSTLLKNLMIQDMLDGKGFAYISPHPSDPEDVLGMVPKNRVDDVIYFNPTDIQNPIGLNLFEFDPAHPEQKDFLIQQAISMLYELYDPNRQGMMGARFEQMFRPAALTAMADPEGGTIIDLPKLFVDKEFLESKLKYVTAPDVIEFWRKEMPASSKSNDHGELISWFSSKLGAFRTNEMMRNIVGQLKSGINLRKAMDEGKIVIISLDKAKIGDINAKLLGMIFLTQFAVAALSRSDMPSDQIRPFTLYIDEFQNFLTDIVKTVLAEARKYKLSLVMANQYIGQLTDEIKNAVFGNVGSLISFRVGPEDTDILVKQFQGVFGADDLIAMPNLNAGIKMLAGGIPTNPFTIFIPFPDKRPNMDIARALKRLSASKYARPKSEVDRENYERMKDDTPAQGAAGSVKDEIEAMKPKSFLDDFLTKKGVQPVSGASTNINPSLSNTVTPTAATMPAPTAMPSDTLQVSSEPAQANSGGEFIIR